MNSRLRALRAARSPLPAAPRSAMVVALKRYLGFGNQALHRSALRRRERFQKLDLDQHVREIGEW